jgi:hypothetical protein
VDDDAKTPELEVKQIRTATAAGDTGFARMTTQLAATLKVKLASWASLDDTFSARRVPLVVDKWQIQNGLLLTTSFTVL